MTQVLSDVKSVGGVVGCFAYDIKAGVIAAEVPALFKPAKLAEVGRALAKTMKAATMSLPDGADISFYFEEILIVARELKKGTVLVVLCDPGMNVNLLSMSLNLAMDELVEMAQRLAQTPPQAAHPAPPDPPPARPATPPAATQKPKPAPEHALDAETQRALEAALAKVVGPMAAIIYRDSYETWTSSGNGGAGGLVTVICREIGDEGKAAKFSALAANLIMNEGKGHE